VHCGPLPQLLSSLFHGSLRPAALRNNGDSDPLESIGKARCRSSVAGRSTPSGTNFGIKKLLHTSKEHEDFCCLSRFLHKDLYLLKKRLLHRAAKINNKNIT
jgi:hypothetical protein